MLCVRRGGEAERLFGFVLEGEGEETRGIGFVLRERRMGIGFVLLQRRWEFALC